MRGLSNETKRIILMVVLLLSIVSLPRLLIGQEVEIIKSDKSFSKVRAGETVNFSLIFERDGGLFDKHYEMTDIETYGDWNVNIDGTSIYISPNSKKEIVFTIDIPENAEDGDNYYYQFGLVEPDGYSYEGHSFNVYVDNSVSSEIAEGGGSNRRGYGSLRPSIFSIIPVVLIIVSATSLRKLHKITKSQTPGALKENEPLTQGIKGSYQGSGSLKSCRTVINIINIVAFVWIITFLNLVVLPIIEVSIMLWILFLSWVIALLIFTVWRFIFLDKIYKKKIKSGENRDLRKLLLLDSLGVIALHGWAGFWIGFSFGSKLSTALITTISYIIFISVVMLLVLAFEGIFTEEMITKRGEYPDKFGSQDKGLRQGGMRTRIPHQRNYRQAPYRGYIYINCSNCNSTFKTSNYNREPRCPHCRVRFNRCGYCGNLFKIRYIKCPFCNRYYMFRLVEVVLGVLLFIFSIFMLLYAIIYRDLWVGLASSIPFLIVFLLFTGRPVHPWAYLVQE